MERPDIPRWPEQLRAGMAEIERTFRRLQLVYRPRLMRGPKYEREAVYQPVDVLVLLIKQAPGIWDLSADEIAAIAERNAILITGGFND